MTMGNDSFRKVDTDEIKARVSLLDLLDDDGLKPRRSGTNHMVCCPFHDERSPSFTIFPDGRFKCFGCGEYGDVITYVRKTHGIGFFEAVEILRVRAGILPGRDLPPARPAAAKVKSEPWRAYTMTSAERSRSVAMAAALLEDEDALKGIANSRGWKPSTIRQLAFHRALGIYSGKLVCLYPTGAKIRLKPLSRDLAASFEGAPFRWLFGKPDSLWRSDQISSATETISIVEGETACISLLNSGVDNGSTDIAVAAASASSWRNEWAPLFRGRKVIIWPDADDAGELLRDRIVTSLRCTASSIKVVNLREEAHQ